MFALRNTCRHHGRRSIIPPSLRQRQQSATPALSTSKQALVSTVSLLQPQPLHQYDFCGGDGGGLDCHGDDVSVSSSSPLVPRMVKSSHYGTITSANNSAFSVFGEIILRRVGPMINWYHHDHTAASAGAVNDVVNNPFATTTTMSSNSSSSCSSSITSLFLDFIWQMSSTLKKRRSKMNKHKLQKRRKKERRKNKK